ncbi:SLOG family protein [Kurthia sibirica]|uniref:UPF0398 protein DEX24_02550 n=1 Tax=Kurthia sibirica TaxID=202750 RepID=A0A2U3AQ64_9BACL|nr:DUF1273 domain-containing protein [Kurthia sibirica]PWI26659.1 hypothetical protein DEX24_02550 [Kurthia sibirica]GEK32923.1 UPF0398 protein [Kurthia sibirica]
MIKKITITGYKAHELGIFNDDHAGIPVIKHALTERLITLLEDGLEWVLISGQLGVEAWTAEIIWALKDDYPQLKYAVMTPFLEQEKNWNDSKKEKYNAIIQAADFVTSLTNRPYEAPWQFVEKNKFFITHSDALLIVYDEENEGSPIYIKQLAEKFSETNEYPIYTIDAYDLQSIADEIQQEEWQE